MLQRSSPEPYSQPGTPEGIFRPAQREVATSRCSRHWEDAACGRGGTCPAGPYSSANPGSAIVHGDNIVVEIVWRSAPSRESRRVDTIVLSCPNLVGATDVALPATGGGTEVDTVLPRAGVTVD